jgi:hypothetical protein
MNSLAVSATALSIATLALACNRPAKCNSYETAVPLPEEWKALNLPLPEKSLFCQNRTYPKDIVVVTKNAHVADVVLPMSHRLEADGFEPDRDRPPYGSGGFHAGFHHALQGVLIDGHESDGVVRVELKMYPACAVPDAVSHESLGLKMKVLLAGDKESDYCATLRSILSDEEPTVMLQRSSTAMQAPKDLMAALAAARARGGPVETIEPQWGPAKGDPVLYDKRFYMNKAYDGVRARLQSERPRSPPTVVLVGGKRLGFFSPYGTWLGTYE